MKDDIIENIIENLLFVVPVLHKRLSKVNPLEVDPDVKLTRLHIMIMGKLNEEGRQRATEIGRDFIILKPQMTRIIKELVKVGMIEKQPDNTDRRATYLVLTAYGKSTLEKFRKLFKKSLTAQLSNFSDRELSEFSAVMTRLREMGSKLDR